MITKVLVFSDKWVDFQKKINRLSKKANKFGLPSIEVNTLGEKIDEYGRWLDVQLVHEKIVSEEGWVLIAKIEKTDQGNNVVTNTYGHEGVNDIPSKYLESNNECEVCKRKHFRKRSFIVKNIHTGEMRQAGSTCLKDFVGYDIEKVSLYYDEIDDSFRDPFGIEGLRSIDVFDLLTIAIDEIKENGYIRADCKTARPTKEVVLNEYSKMNVFRYNVTPTNEVNIKELDNFLKRKEELTEDIQKMIDYFKSDSFRATTEFKERVKIAYASVVDGKAPEKFAGFFISSVLAKDKVDEIEERKALDCQYFGKVKDKFQINNAKVLLIKYIPSNFNGSYLYTFDYKEGDTTYTFVWFSSVYYENVRKGDIVTLKGTIKDHKEYGEVKQTVVTRCKIIV